MKTTCDEIEPLLASYAIEAADLDERWRVEAHLDACEACQTVLAEYQLVGEGLLHMPPPVQPPARLRARLIARTASSPASPAWRGRLGLLWSPLLRVVAVLGFAILLVLNLALLREQRDLQRAQQAVAEQSVIYETAVALLSHPGSRVAQVEGEAGYYGAIVYDPGLDVAVLHVRGLEPLPAGQAYQVWLIEPDGKRISGGVFQITGESRFVSQVIASPTALREYVGIGVTVEPARGSAAPTGPRVLGAGL